jgi:hypothetical protein
LIVVNSGERDVLEGVAEFSARFFRARERRRPTGHGLGRELAASCRRASRTRPSRLTPTLPPDRLWWTLRLQFVVADVPARGARAYAAAYGEHPASNGPASFWEQAASGDNASLIVYETSVPRAAQ